MNQWVRFLLLVFVLMLVAGCVGPSLNTSNRAKGIIAFHDTNLGLRATVTLNGYSFTTEDGRFTVPLDAGVYTFKVSTLLGEYSGHGEYDGQSDVRIEVPPFEGWSRELFNEIAILSIEGEESNLGTARWPIGKTIRVWIQPHNEVNGVQPEDVDLAWSVLKDWQALLNNAISIQRVTDRNNADLVYKWGEGHGGGACFAPDYEIESAVIVVGVNSASEKDVHYHEVGHCVAGLLHSSNPKHIMYVSDSIPGVLGDAIIPSDVEINMARLIYSIPVLTPTLPLN